MKRLVWEQNAVEAIRGLMAGSRDIGKAMNFMARVWGGRAFGVASALALALIFCVPAPSAQAQGSRKDDIVFGPTGHPVANATVTVCAATATGTPCTPLATLYTDATLTTTAANPFQADGIGKPSLLRAGGAVPGANHGTSD